MLNNKVSLNAIIIFSFLLLIGCKQQAKELTLEEKKTLAIESRRIPTSKDQKISFKVPESIIGRGPQITEIFSHMEKIYSYCSDRKRKYKNDEASRKYQSYPRSRDSHQSILSKGNVT